MNKNPLFKDLWRLSTVGYNSWWILRPIVYIEFSGIVKGIQYSVRFRKTVHEVRASDRRLWNKVDSGKWGARFDQNMWYLNSQIRNTFNMILCRQSTVYRTMGVHGTFGTVFRICPWLLLPWTLNVNFKVQIDYGCSLHHNNYIANSASDKRKI